MSTRVINLRTCTPKERAGAINVGRPSKWGNPFKIGRDGTREEVIAKYRAWIMNQPDLLAEVATLKGETLACWCFPKRCHAEVLAELAEATGAQP
jgi:hypothetical protein